MSSQNYKDKLDQFINENNEIKFATLEGENTHERIANHFNTLRELLQLSGLQEILENGNSTEVGTEARLLGGVLIESFLKISTNIGALEPEDDFQHYLGVLANGQVKLAPKPGDSTDTRLSNLADDLDETEQDEIKTKLNIASPYIEILDQFNDVNGDLDLDLITEEGTYVLKTMRDQDLNGLPQYAGDGPLNVQIDVFKSGSYTYQRAIYFSVTQTKPSIAYRVKYGSGSYMPWIDLYDQIDKKNFLQEMNNQADIRFWKGTQAQYDAITTKNPQTLYIDSNTGLIGNGVTPTITASVITNYGIDIATQTEHWNIVMTGNTDFGFTNMFASGNSKVITITLEGDYAFAFPIWLKPLETNDEYDTMGGTLVAEIVINIKNGGTVPSGYYSLQMIDYAL